MNSRDSFTSRRRNAKPFSPGWPVTTIRDVIEAGEHPIHSTCEMPHDCGLWRKLIPTSALTRGGKMKIRSTRRVVFSFHSVCLFFLSAAFALAITDLGTLPGGSGTQAGDAQNREQKPSFISNTLLVKLTPQARANLKAKGEDV